MWESNSLDEDFLEHGSDNRERQVGRSHGKLHDAVLGYFLPQDWVLTKSEEQKFLKERKILESDEDEEPEEEEAQIEENIKEPA